jgi:DNA-binding transcriptional MerR regulator
MKKRVRLVSNFFTTEPPRMPTYGTGMAAEILGLPIWRLQRFIDSRQYNISPSGQLGEGRGSRRVFTREDLRRISLANWLLTDGFATQFVGSVVRQVEDSDLDVYIGHEGKETPPSLVFQRGKDGPIVRIYSAKRAATINDAYYRLDLNDVFAEVDAGIARLQKSQ